MGSPAKVLFIGIDAGDKDLIQQWSSDGHLPTFRKLFRSSAWSITNSPPGLYVGAIWPSFYTGVSPARHARYCFRQLVPGSYDVQWISPRDVRHEPFWDALDRSGKRVAVIDVPKTYPSRLANGIQIVDWGSHDPDAAGFCTWPESVAPEIETRYDPDSMHCCNAFRTTGEEFRDFRDHLIERIRKKTALSAAWLAKGDWHQKFDPQLLEAAGNPILAVYQAVDSGIAELLEQAGDDAHVVVFASHGMGPHYDATFMLDDILLRLEGAPQARKRDALAPLAKTLWKLLPRQVRDAARPVRDKARYNLGVDESAQRAGSRRDW
jgi:predicted AlkP superfamily phosphohydrolase/phosphomutase